MALILTASSNEHLSDKCAAHKSFYIGEIETMLEKIGWLFHVGFPSFAFSVKKKAFLGIMG
jgi:hypothetical protein